MRVRGRSAFQGAQGETQRPTNLMRIGAIRNEKETIHISGRETRNLLPIIHTGIGRQERVFPFMRRLV